MIAALFVETDGVYYGLPDVDPWDEARDARTYAGPWRVVAHPPCQRRYECFAEKGLAMTDDEKIRGAADILVHELGRLGDVINELDALRIARRLYELWCERPVHRDMAPGEIAQRHRARYEEQYPELYSED